jgi:hypothetical protein
MVQRTEVDVEGGCGFSGINRLTRNFEMALGTIDDAIR